MNRNELYDVADVLINIAAANTIDAGGEKAVRDVKEIKLAILKWAGEHKIEGWKTSLACMAIASDFIRWCAERKTSGIEDVMIDSKLADPGDIDKTEN